MSLHPLRPYQVEALARGSACIAEGAKRILLCMPTGTGKTRTAVEACVLHVKLGGIPMCVVPRRELYKQMVGALIAAGLEPGHDVFVRTIQELTSKNALIPRATLLVLDEARHYLADKWGMLRTALPDALILGLDATPERGDGKGLGELFERLVEAISIADAVAQGYLVPYDLRRPDRALAPGELAQDPFDFYMQQARGSSGVVFNRSVQEALDLAERFRGAGITAEAVWGEMPTSSRDAKLAAFADGKIQVLTNMNLLTEGWDAPRTETVILAKSFLTAGGVIQAAGRGARPFPGKERCLLVDLTGCTHHNHIGEPDEPGRTWQLHGLASKRAVVSEVRFCPVCGSPVGGAECEQCGYAGTEMKKRKPRILGLPVERFARQRQESDEQKARKLAFYLAEARRLGRNPYSANHRFNGVYGHMPTPQIKALARRAG